MSVQGYTQDEINRIANMMHEQGKSPIKIRGLAYERRLEALDELIAGDADRARELAVDGRTHERIAEAMEGSVE